MGRAGESAVSHTTPCAAYNGHHLSLTYSGQGQPNHIPWRRGDDDNTLKCAFDLGNITSRGLHLSEPALGLVFA